ncbi:MAG: HAMP domain-containing protein, partial [Hyphomicrobiales bacterium]
MQQDTIRFGVTAKIIAAFSAMLITAALASSITYWRSGATVESTRAAAKLQDGLERLADYKRSMDIATGSVRAFLLTGDRSLLARYQESLPVRAERLASLEKSGVVSTGEASALEAAFLKWQTDFAERQVKLMRDPLTVDLARAIESTGEPQKAIDGAEAALNGMRMALLGRIAEAEEIQNANMATLLSVAIASGAVSLALTLLFAWLGYRMISRPMRELAETTRALADGHLESEIGHTGRGDEIGAVSKALLVFRDGLARSRELETEAKKTEEQRRAERKRELEELASRFESEVKSVVALVSSAAEQLSASAGGLSAIAEETSAQVNSVSHSSTEASSNVNSVATAAEQLSSSITEIGSQITSNSSLVNGAADE